MSLDACGIDLFKEIDRHSEVDVAHTVNGETYRVLARIKHTVLARAVVLEFQKIVSVVKRKDVFCFASVNKFLAHDFYLFHFVFMIFYLLNSASIA